MDQGGPNNGAISTLEVFHGSVRICSRLKDWAGFAEFLCFICVLQSERNNYTS